MISRHLADFWLQHLTLFTPKKINQMAASFPCPEDLFEHPPDALRDKGISLTFPEAGQYEAFRDEDKLKMLEDGYLASGIRFASSGDKAFPAGTEGLSDPPRGLFYKGSLPAKEGFSVSIVGSRACTVYGKEMAYFFGRELAKKGLRIISGMALGIDGFAQKGAVSLSSDPACGRSFAVLAGGVDICYPRENIGLYRELSGNGHGILSERPPKTPAHPRDFPVRNRIIAALSDVLIVIEAAENSGSLITVSHALQLGRDVFVLPDRKSVV